MLESPREVYIYTAANTQGGGKKTHKRKRSLVKMDKTETEYQTDNGQQFSEENIGKSVCNSGSKCADIERGGIWVIIR